MPVTDVDWMRHGVDWFGWMTPGEVKHFPLAERDGGRGGRHRQIADASRLPAVRQDDDVREHDIEQFIRLEREVWEALANGDGQADGRLLSDDFLGVYTVGFADRAAPSPNSPTARR